MQKTYVLDTNILMQYPDALFGFEDNEVVVPITVLEELDNHKNDSGEAGYNARTSIRTIQSLIRKSARTTLPNGGALRIETDCLSRYDAIMPEQWSKMKPDNQILCVVMELMLQVEHPVILVTNDAGLFVKAASLGINVEELKQTEVNPEKLYTGRLDLDVPDPVMDDLRKGICTRRELLTFCDEKDLVPNEFLEITSETKGVFLGKISPDGQDVLPLPESKNHPFGVSPRKNGQKMLWDALFNPDIPLILVNGIAGTGKTFLATAFGLDFVYDGKETNNERRFIYTRTRTLGEEDPGFLKGDLEEKMKPLMAPMYDNLRELLRGEDPEQAKIHIQDMLSDEVIQLESMAYIRGRSIPDAVIVIDEAQNAAPKQILEIVTRCAANTKIIVMGDPDQIDNAHLSKRNNGLNFAIDRMKGSPMAATITFKESESVRSPLAIEAAKRLRVD